MEKKNQLSGLLLEKKTLVIVFALSTIVVSVAAPLKSYSMQWLIDSSSMAEAFQYVLLSLVVVAISHASEYFCKQSYNKMAVRSLARIRERLMKVYADSSMNAYLQESTGDRLSVLTNDLRVIMDEYYMQIFNVAIWGGMALVAMVMIASISPIMLAIVLVMGILPLITPRIMAGRMSSTRSLFSKAMAAYTTKTGELLRGYEALTASSGRKYWDESHKEVSDDLYDKDYVLRRTMNTSSIVVSLSAWFPSIGILIVGVFLVFHGKISIGYLVTAYSLSSFVLGPLRMASDAIIKLRSCRGIVSKVENVMANETQEEGVEEVSQIDEITFDQVTFSYPDAEHPALQDVTFTVRRGEKAAIVGLSGSGKSTAVKLLYRYYEDYGGRICINKTPLSHLKRSSYYNKVALIPQTPYVFSDTIYNNLCLYQPFSDEEIDRAIGLSGLTSFIAEQKDGLQTVLMENGHKLSGGQVQRIAHGRTILRHSEVVLVDESTSSLDVETTNEIIENLLHMDCTVIMITHDIFGRYMDHFDQILYMENGEITERGTFRTLLDQRGAFARLYDGETK